MTFKQKASTFLEFEILFMVLTGFYFAIIPVLGALLSILMVLFHFILFFYIFWSLNTQITIDERGIVCTKAEDQLWAYNWDEIAGFKRFSCAGHPSVGILLYNSDGTVENICEIDRYFQLSKSAKKALAKYYIPPNG